MRQELKLSFRGSSGESKKDAEEINMNLRKLMSFVGTITLGLFLLAVCGDALIAQGQTMEKTTPSSAAKPEEPKLTVKGKIDYMERLGGYCVRGVEPGGEFFIVNPNAKVLKQLKESGKTVTIEARVAARGAEYLIIEKIDGKKYSGKRPAK